MTIIFLYGHAPYHWFYTMALKLNHYHAYRGNVPIIIMCMLFFTSQHALSQHILSVDTSTPRTDDTITIVPTTPIDITGCGENVFWDFSEIESTGKTITRRYFRDNDSTFKSVDNTFLIEYELADNNLSIKSIESTLKDCRFDIPVSIQAFPFAYGNTSTNTFHGYGSYSKSLNIEMKGTLVNEADAFGSIITASDTLRNVIRIHQTIICATNMFSPTDADVSEESENKQEIIDKYLWYARGYRYPIYETQSITNYDNLIPVSTETHSFCCLPENQLLPNDSINSNILLSDSILASQNKDIFLYTATYNGNDFSLDYVLEADANVNAILCNGQGIVFDRVSFTAREGETGSVSLPTNNLRKGEYVVYINVNGRVYNEKFSKR